MTGPAWLAGVFAAMMLLVAVCCAGRLVIVRLRGRDTELDADGLHILMGVAMAGMFEPQLSPVPGTVWRAVFVAAAAWFSWQAVRTRGGARPRASRCAHPAPHAVECTAMVYMLLPAGARAIGRAPGMTMAGMSRAGGAAAGNPALALILALFMVGYILWTTDRLASLSRARLARPRDERRSRQPALNPAGQPALAPRLAASYKITMGIAMGYMLVTML